VGSTELEEKKREKKKRENNRITIPECGVSERQPVGHRLGELMFSVPVQKIAQLSSAH